MEYALAIIVLCCCTFLHGGNAKGQAQRKGDSTGPQFSWNTVPVFFHSGYRTGLGFPPEALKIISKFSLVTINKWQGCQDAAYTTEEDAIIHAARQIKAISPSTTVIAWYDSFRIYANGSLNPSARDTRGQFCIHNLHSQFLEKHHEYLLRNSSDQLAVESFADLHVYDFSKGFVQDYWTAMCLNATSSGVIDGCGCDGSQSRANTNQIPHIDPDLAEKWNAGKVAMMQKTQRELQLRSKKGQGLLIGKQPWEVGVYVDSMMHENCKPDNKTITMLRELAARATTDKRLFVVECHFHKLLMDNVAAFLIGMGEYHYFGSGAFFQSDPDFSSRWDDELLGSALGRPHGLAVYYKDSQVWTRSFGSGTNVTFFLTTSTGIISWSHGVD